MTMSSHRFHDFLYLSDVKNKVVSKGVSRLTSAIFMTGVSCVLGAALSACSESEKTAGGGPSGTEAGNAITAQIFDITAKPSINARVTLIRSESLDGLSESNAVETVTDQDGRLSIQNVHTGSYTLVIADSTGALQKNVIYIEGESAELGSDTLALKASVSGSPAELAGQNGFIKIRGMDYTAPVVNGSFTLADLPAGPMNLVFIPEAGDTISINVLGIAGTSTDLTTFEETPKVSYKIDLEDFDALPFRGWKHRLAPEFCPNGGSWYFNYNALTMTPLFFDFTYFSLKNFPYQVTPEDGAIAHMVAIDNADSNTYNWITLVDSNSFQWKGAMDSSDLDKWMLIGVQLSDSLKSVDFTDVDSVVFDAAGNGNVLFQLAHEFTADSLIYVGGAEISLDSSWIHYSFPLHGEGGILDSHVPDVNQISTLRWTLTKTTEFKLDNIKLYTQDVNSIWR